MIAREYDKLKISKLNLDIEQRASLGPLADSRSQFIINILQHDKQKMGWL